MIENLDIASRFIYQGNRFPISLIFFVTNKCNAKCDFCFYKRNLNKDKKELSLREIEKISRSIRLFNLSLTGGEPFIRKDLHEVAYLFYKNSRVKYLSIPTNGILTDKIVSSTNETLKRCPKLLLEVSISIHGLHAANDKLILVPGSFKKAMNTYKRLKQLQGSGFKNLRVCFNLLVSEQNYKDLSSIYNYLAKLKPDNIFPILLRDIPRDKKQYLKAYESLIKHVKKDLENGKYGYKGSLSIINRRDTLSRELALQTVRKSKQLVPCFAGSLIAVINEIGDVYPCELLNKKLGSLKEHDYDFKKLWSSGKARRIRKEIRKSSCYCTHECFLNLNVFFDKKNLLKLVFRI